MYASCQNDTGWYQEKKFIWLEKTNNADLLKRIGEIVEQLGKKFMKKEGDLLTVIHVYAHTGKDDWKSKWNAEADKAAKAGADMHQHLIHGSTPFITPQESRHVGVGSSRPHICTGGSISRRVLPRCWYLGTSIVVYLL